MKRTFLLLLVAAASIVAQTTRTFTASLTATGTTTATQVEANYHTVQVTVTGSPSACTVRLEGSLDNVNFFDLSGSQTCTSSTMFHVDGKPVSYVRANLLTLSGGTSPSVAVAYKGSN